MQKNQVRPCDREMDNTSMDVSWSAVLREATLVSGPKPGQSDSAGNMMPCGDGRWTKDLFLRLHFDKPLPAAVIDAIPDPSGKKMQPLLVVSSHERFAGVHRIVHADFDGMCVLCFVPQFEGSAFKPVNWTLLAPPADDKDANLCITPLERPDESASHVDMSTEKVKFRPLPPLLSQHKDSQGGVLVSRSQTYDSRAEKERRGQGEESRGKESLVSIAPPLKFHSRMNMFHLDEINTVAQTFRADVFCEFRLRGVSSEPSMDLVHTLLDAYGFREDMFEVMMAIEIISQERWTALTRSSTRPGTYDYSLKLRTRAVFAEQYELEDFPFDEQDIHICLTLNIPCLRAVLLENLEFPSVMMHRTFQQKSVFDIVYDDVLKVLASKSDPSESGAGFVYPRITFNTTLSRQYGYYISNLFLPMTVLTYLSAASLAIDADGQHLSTADRLSVTLTLMVV
jgi:hypothetical protein